MVYLDTSVLVALLTNEPAAGRVTDWLKTKQAGTLHLSGWTITEFSSAPVAESSHRTDQPPAT